MSSYLKINANQAGPFDNNYNLVDFDIPAGVYDFSESYVNLNMGITYASIPAGSTVYSSVDSVGDDNFYYNCDIVRTAVLDSEVMPSMENLRECNTFGQNIKHLTLSDSEKLNEYGYNTPSIRTIGQKGDFQTFKPVDGEVNNIGTVVGRNIPNPEWKIKLKDILEGLGNVKEYPGDKLGKTRLSLELLPGLFKSIIFNPLRNYNNPGTSIPVAAAALGATTLESNAAEFTAENIPLYVGMPITIVRAGGANSNNVITGIELGTDGKITISLSTALAAAVAAADTIELNASATTTLSFTHAELVVKKLNKVKSDVKELTYLTYSTEVAEGTSLEVYERLFYVEPECVNLFVMFPQGNISYNDNLQQFRLRINNVDATNRNVEFQDALYMDRLNMTLMNAGKQLKNLRQYNPFTKAGASGPENGETLKIIANPMPLTAQQKQVQLTFQSSAGVNIPSIVLFKQLYKSIKL